MHKMSLLSRLFGKKRLNLPKIVVILGPTASGKTDLGLALAKKFDGEVVNADSRQVYKEMNIGTAKPAGEWRASEDSSSLRQLAELARNDNIPKRYLVENIPHHLMDIVAPDAEFTLADFKQHAQAAIADILSRGKLPIVIGGTGLYIWSLVDNLEIPRVAPDTRLRAELEKKSPEELVAMLKKIDPESAETIDTKNPRRVLRALEVAITSGESFVSAQKKGAPLYDALQIGIDWPREELYRRIDERVDRQMDRGLLEETKTLAQKYAWELPSMSGIGYRQLGYFLRGEIPLAEAVEILKRDTRRYAKRQMTWFKRDKRIHWLPGPDHTGAEKLLKEFIK